MTCLGILEWAHAVIDRAVLRLLPIIIGLFLLLCWVGIIRVRGTPFARQQPNMMVKDEAEYHFCYNILGDFGGLVPLGEQHCSYRNHANEGCEHDFKMSKINC